MHEKRDEATEIERNQSDTLYLCNFRVSVDGDWLCLKEVDDQELASEAASLSSGPTSSSEVRQRKPPDSLSITPELERLETREKLSNATISTLLRISQTLAVESLPQLTSTSRVG